MDYAITMSDGSVAIMRTVSGSAAENVAKWHPDARARVVSHAPIDVALIPPDRTFRNAWTFDGKAVAVDMAKARDIWRDRLRSERAPLLADLDQAYMRADEAGDVAGKASIAAQKQALRDVPADPSIDAAATPDALQALTIEVIAASAVTTASTELSAEQPVSATLIPAA